MNIFGIGEIELLLIILIALVVAGPQRMIKWMYVLGQWAAKLRNIWGEASATLQKELNEAGLDVQVPKDLPTRSNIRKMTEKALKPLADPVKEMVDEVKQVEKEVKDTAKQASDQVREVATIPSANGTKSPADEKPNDFGTWSGS